MDSSGSLSGLREKLARGVVPGDFFDGFPDHKERGGPVGKVVGGGCSGDDEAGVGCDPEERRGGNNPAAVCGGEVRSAHSQWD